MRELERDTVVNGAIFSTIKWLNLELFLTVLRQLEFESLLASSTSCLWPYIDATKPEDFCNLMSSVWLRQVIVMPTLLASVKTLFEPPHFLLLLCT